MLAANSTKQTTARPIPPLQRATWDRPGPCSTPYLILMLAIVAVAGLLAQIINLPGIVGAFLAGLAVNAAVHDKPAKEKLKFFGNSFFIPLDNPDVVGLSAPSLFVIQSRARNTASRSRNPWRYR